MADPGRDATVACAVALGRLPSELDDVPVAERNEVLAHLERRAQG